MSTVILLFFGILAVGAVGVIAVAQYQRRQYEIKRQAYEELETPGLNQPPSPVSIFAPVSLATLGLVAIGGMFLATAWVQENTIQGLKDDLSQHIATAPNSTSTSSSTTTTTIVQLANGTAIQIDNTTIQAHTAVTLTQAKAYTDTEVGALETSLVTQIATAESDANTYCDSSIAALETNFTAADNYCDASISSLAANFTAVYDYCDAAVAEVDISGANGYTDAAVAALSTNFTAATNDANDYCDASISSLAANFTAVYDYCDAASAANDYTDASIAALSTNFTAATSDAQDYCDASISALSINFTAANDYCDAAVSDLNVAVTEELNRIEALALSALAAGTTIHCWDLNHDGNCTLPTEDTNGDGNCTALDCQGADGNSSFQCWDLDQDHVCDLVTEDKNLDGFCTTLDCHGLPGTNGTDGTPGTQGFHCWDLNENRACDLLTEDLNLDGNCTVADCTHYANGSIELNKVEGPYIDLKYVFDSDADARLKLEGTGDLAIYTGGDGSLKKAVTVNAQQFVGVGISNPSYPMHVQQNSSSFNQMRVYNVNPYGRAGISLYQAYASNDFVMQHAPTGAGYLHNRGGNLTIMAESLHLFSNDVPSVEAIHIDTAGNIGFGMKHSGVHPYAFAGTVSAPTVSAATAIVSTITAQSNSIIAQSGASATTGSRLLLYGNGVNNNYAYYQAARHMFQPLSGGSSTRIEVSANGEMLRLQGTDHAYVSYYRSSDGGPRAGWYGFGGPANTHYTFYNELSGGELQFFTTGGGQVRTNAELNVGGNIVLSGTVDGVDIAAHKTDYDSKIDQDVRTTASPSFGNQVSVSSGNGILANGNVELLTRSSASIGAAGAANRYKLFFDSTNSDKLSKINSTGGVTVIEGSGTGGGEGVCTETCGHAMSLYAGSCTSNAPSNCTSTIERPPILTPTFENSWINFGGAYSNAFYSRDDAGVVTIEGVVKSGTVNSVIFTLPLGYRPPAQVMFVANIADIGTYCHIEVHANGQVKAVTACGNTRVSLSNIVFPTTHNATVSPLSINTTCTTNCWNSVGTSWGPTTDLEGELINSWVSVGGAYATPTAVLNDAGMVVLQGAVKSGVDNNIMILPVGLRPQVQVTVHVYDASSDECRVVVDTSGQVFVVLTYAQCGTTHVALDGITFAVATGSISTTSYTITPCATCETASWSETVPELNVATTVTALNGWTFGAGKVGQSKDPNGYVNLILETTSVGTYGVPCMQLPAGYRPAATLVFSTWGRASASDARPGTLEIQSDGDVIFHTGSGGNLYTLSVRFRASDTTAYAFATRACTGASLICDDTYTPVDSIVMSTTTTPNDTLPVNSGTWELFFDSTNSGKLSKINSNGVVTAIEGSGTGGGEGVCTETCGHAMSLYAGNCVSAAPSNCTSKYPRPTLMTPTFQNSWANYGGAYSNAAFFRDDAGIVMLEGVVASGTVNSVIFTLPVGYRPNATMLFCANIADAGSWCRVDIDSAGQVTATTGCGNTRVSLNGIVFPAAYNPAADAQSINTTCTTGCSSLTGTGWGAPVLLDNFQNTWVSYGAPYAAPSLVMNDAGVVVLQGAVKSGTADDILSIPVGYRPHEVAIQLTYSTSGDECRVYVSPDGRLYQIQAQTHCDKTHISLAGITWVVNVGITATSYPITTCTTCESPWSETMPLATLASDPTILGGWSPPAEYTYYAKDPNTGTVYVHITDSSAVGTAGTAIINLPVGYRPSATLVFPTMGRDISASYAAVPGAIEVRTNGDVVLLAGTLIDFDACFHVAFRAADAVTETTFATRACTGASLICDDTYTPVDSIVMSTTTTPNDTLPVNNGTWELFFDSTNSGKLSKINSNGVVTVIEGSGGGGGNTYNVTNNFHVQELIASTVEYNEYVASLSPNAWFKMIETSGTVVVESMGNYANGTYVNSPTLNQNFGMSGVPTAVSFDGINDYATINSVAPLFVNTNWTVSLWVKKTASGTTMVPFGIHTSTGVNRVLVWFTDTAIRLYWTAGATHVEFPYTVMNTVVHVAVQYETWASVLHLWANGAYQGYADVSAIPFDASNLVSLGQDYDDPGPVTSDFWSGLITNVAIWNTPLTSAQIANIAAAGSGALTVSAYAPPYLELDDQTGVSVGPSQQAGNYRLFFDSNNNGKLSKVNSTGGVTVIEGSGTGGGGGGDTLPVSPVNNSFLVANGAGTWVESSLATTKTILGIDGLSTLPPNPASNSFLTGNGAGDWVESTLSTTKTILGITGLNVQFYPAATAFAVSDLKNKMEFSGGITKVSFGTTSVVFLHMGVRHNVSSDDSAILPFVYIQVPSLRPTVPIVALWTRFGWGSHTPYMAAWKSDGYLYLLDAGFTTKLQLPTASLNTGGTSSAMYSVT